MASSAARISRRGGPSPEGTGKRKTPASSRLYHRHQPSSSQARILRRSPARLRKTNQCPDRGSSPRAWRTRALSPSNDLRRSAGAGEREKRRVAERGSMWGPPVVAGGGGGDRRARRRGRYGCSQRGSACGALQCCQEGMEDSGIEARWNAQAPPAGKDEFKGRWRGGVVVPDMDREEGNRLGGWRRARQAVA